jgi:hypothetical protein
MVRRGLNPCSRKLNRHELRLFDSSTLLERLAAGVELARGPFLHKRHYRQGGIDGRAPPLARRFEIPSVGSRLRHVEEPVARRALGRDRQSLRSEAPPRVHRGKSAATTPS